MPLVVSTDRIAKENFRIEEYNIDAPGGMKVILNWFQIMNDPDNWTEPDKFDPDRFWDENRERGIDSNSYCPSAIERHNCLAMRSALKLVKMGLARVVLDCRLEPAPKSKWPPSFSNEIGLSTISECKVNIVKRSSSERIIHTHL